MTGLALSLVLLSAFAHATWNLLAKRAGGGPAFLWLFDALSILMYAPITAVSILIERPRVGIIELAFIFGSATLHLVYFLLLSSGYRAGDLSLVYPLARGTGPLLATLGAILFLGERPTVLALAGALLIGVGVFLLMGTPQSLRGSGGPLAVAYALLTGVLIAAYTLWDKQAVSGVHIPPLLYNWSSNLGRVLLLSPLVLRRRDEIRSEWRKHRMHALGVAVLSPLSYILVLVALSFSPVSYVAPARELGILIGTAMGSRLLDEGNAVQRLAAAGLMICGVTAIALG